MSFDPDQFLAEAPETDFNPDEFLGQNSAPRIGNNWDRLLGGLDGMDARLGTDEKQAFSNLDMVSGNPKQARAQAITQAYVQEKHPEISHANLELNWPHIRTAYAREQFGMLEPEITDVALYDAISKRHQDEITAQAVSESTAGAWTWKDEAKSDLRSTAANLEKFWESINKPAWELPRAPDNLPDLPGMGMQNPALAGAVWNGLAPLFESAVATPLGIATLGLAAPLQAAAKTYPLAKAALLGMEGGFTALIGWGTYKGAKQLPKVFSDPEASFQEKATKATEVVASGAATLLGALGTGLTAFPGKDAVRIVKEMDGKPPQEMANILRKEAEVLETPEAQKPVLEAAKQLEKLSPADVVEAPKEAKPTEMVGEPVAQSLENGGYVVTDARGKLIDYAATKEDAAAIAAKAKEKVEGEVAPKEEVQPTVKEEEAVIEKSEKLTGIKNEAVDAELKSMGLEPATHGEKTSQAKVIVAAAEKMKADPEAGVRLVQELSDNPRPHTPEEVGLLAYENNRLRIERDAAERALIEAKNMGDTVALSDAEARVSKAISDYQKAADVFAQSGTYNAQAQALRKIMLKEDYSLARMEQQRSVAKGGETLTPEERTEIKELHDKIAATQKAFDDYVAAQQAKVTKMPKQGKTAKTLSEHAAEARKRIFDRMKEGRAASGINPEDIRDYAIVGADLLARGVRDFATWSSNMLKEFGERIKPHLEDIFNQASDIKAEEARLTAYKTRTEKGTQKLRAKMETKDFSKAEKKPLHLDEEANRLQAEHEIAKLEYQNLLERDRYQKSSQLSKGVQQTLGVYDAARLLMTTGEFSFILRQGKFAALSHPITAAKAIPNMLKAFVADPATAHAINLQVLNHSDAVRAKAAKLHLLDEGQKITRQEEILVGKVLAEKIPVVGKAVAAFNQAATVFLNKLRFDVWNQMRKVGMTPAEEKQLAMFVNEATGRGGLGSLEQAAIPLARVMFSPRYFASRLQLVAGHSLWGGTMATRRAIATEYARALVGLGLYYSMLNLALSGGKNDPVVSMDPRSSDFGKVRLGNTRVDPLAGISQVVVFGARTATGEKTNAKGHTNPIRGEHIPYGGSTWTDVAASFARSKLHPVPGAVVNLFNGTDLSGNEADLLNQSANLVAPITYTDIYQALEEQNLPEGVAVSLLAILGEGLQTYNSQKSTKPPATTSRE